MRAPAILLAAATAAAEVPAVQQRASLLRAPWLPRTPGGCRDRSCCERQCKLNGHPAAPAAPPRPSCAEACMMVIQGSSEEQVGAVCRKPTGPALPGDVCPKGETGPEGKLSGDACLAGAFLGNPPSSVVVPRGAQPQKLKPDSFFWHMDIQGKSIGRGFSWYTRIFSLFQEGHPMNVQMGMGGTWLAAEGLQYDRCPCKPGGFGSDCCETHECSCAGWLFESFEGGPGYWFNQLPTTSSKWRVGDSVGCYSYYTGSPLFQFGDYPGHDCDKMGIIQVSNQLVMAPDGITFDFRGMIGVAYAHTTLGKVNDSDTRNFWTVILDSENFAGPICYFAAEFWGHRQPGYENVSKHFGDYSTCPDLSQGSCAFEWNTLETYKASNGDFKIPKMTLPYKGGRTMLMMNHRAYNDSELADPLEDALRTGTLDVSKLFPSGRRHPCVQGDSAATFGLENRTGVQVGTLHTDIEDGECTWAVKLQNDTCPEDGPCWFPQYVRNDSGTFVPISESQAPPELQKQSFTTKSGGKNYDQLAQIGSRKCLTAPGPSDPRLFCVQTGQRDVDPASRTWVGFKWYRFADQPGLQQANLDQKQRDYMQARIETLHKMVGRTSRWMKSKRAAEEGLSLIDNAVLVTPPKGLEIGHVPIALYEGPGKPDGCTGEPPSPPSPPSPPRPTPAPPPPTPAPPPPATCDGWCLSAGHCCKGAVSSFQHPSCSMGCFIAQHAASEAECEAQCRKADNTCAWSYAGKDMNNCDSCPKVGERECSAADGVEECLFGCKHGGNW
eukprot:TRINITY_DN3012_c0_g1_i1.p1 TRINITY_DN3012_c0_g1~~TRINITY_DN3012_c0_g1_i1.p1  ORF type:complete len:779 (+),score=206.78 TRINITY_DN3012_c0_g1_i1:113-2449(+)